MRFYADLHLHSRFAYATSKYGTLSELAYWAAKKGLHVLATGDFTHPAWRAELKEQLVPVEGGLFTLKQELADEVRKRLSLPYAALPHFMLCVEVSTVYMQSGRVRKLHHLIYVPTMEAADTLSAKLATYGKLEEDGRPTLTLSSAELLHLVLDVHEEAYLIPAHIWTPWFGLLGSRGGFNSLIECYGDVSSYIFACETGLSSDPELGRRVSFLDNMRMVSFSDAHSPQKLGREATIFDTELSYSCIRRALKTGKGYIGTLEFFPEEGKYFLDGHRKCNIKLEPDETKAMQSRCPVCGRRLTEGVLHRIESLADRSAQAAAKLAEQHAVLHLIPLTEILSEIAGVSIASKKVAREYEQLLTQFGSELSMLIDMPLEEIHAYSPTLAEGIRRLRAGEVIRNPGFDGIYGTIKVFAEGELRQKLL